MSTNPIALVPKPSNDYSILRDCDYLKQLTLLRPGLARHHALPVSAEHRLLKTAKVNRRLSVVEELKAVILINLQRATRLRPSIF